MTVTRRADGRGADDSEVIEGADGPSVNGADGDGASSTTRRPWLRHLLLRLHFYAGLFVGPFLLVATLTGGLYALAPQLEQVVHGDELHVAASDAPVPLSRQVESALAVRSEADLVAVRPAPTPGETTRVFFSDPSLDSSTRVGVFVDPGTGEVVGELPVYGSSGALPFRAWLSGFHRHLQLGEVGRIYSELAASWLGIVTLAGIYLWWKRARRRRANGASVVGFDRTGGPRALTLSRHSTVGIVIAVVLLFLSATGLTWSTYAGANVANLRQAIGWETPAVSAALDEHAGHGASAGGTGEGDGAAVSWRDIDLVSQAADERGFDGHREIMLPAEPGKAWTVEEVSRAWPLQADAIAVSTAGGAAEVVDEVRFEDWPLAAKLADLGIAAHMGLLFGLPNALALVAVAAGLVVVILWGYAMWWRRRPTRNGNGRWAGPPAPRGALRRAHPAAVAVIVVVAVVIGRFLPVLGLSLLGFLLVDLVLGWVRRRGSKEPAPAA